MSKNIDSETLVAIEIFISKLATKVNFLNVILFGSRARGDHTKDSDADLAVVINDEMTYLIDLQHLMSDFSYEVLLEKGIRIQATPIGINEWNNPNISRYAKLIFNIKKDGLTLLPLQSESSHLTPLVQSSFDSDGRATRE